jgi:hypothetical protein
MIRPFTVICAALAAGAVLYTYQSKHAVQLLDRQIEKTLADTSSLREQSRTLKAEFTLRENPERLRMFADQYLSLKPMLPTQFTTMAELNAKLPAPRAMTPSTAPADTTEEPAVALGAEGHDETELVAEELPIPPLPVPAPPIVLAANQPLPTPKPAPPRPPEVQAFAPLPVPQKALPIQAAPPRPTPVQAPPIQAEPPRAPIQAQVVRAPAPPVQMRPQAPIYTAPMQAPQFVQGGSLLGMAHGGMAAPVPIPRPMPIAPPLRRRPTLRP